LSLLLLLSFGQAAIDSQALLILIVISVVTDIIMALLLLGNYWSEGATVGAIALDVLVIATSLVLGGTEAMWLALLPPAAAGFYFEWLPSGIVSTISAAVVVVANLIVSSTQQMFDAPSFIIVLIGTALVGPMVALLRRDEHTIAEILDRDKQAQRTSQIANEYMRVVYEMAAVLSASKLNPRRVISSAVEFGIEGLQRVEVEPPLFGSVFLFDQPDQHDENLGPIMKLAYASATVSPRIQTAVLMGEGGVVADAIQTYRPAVSHSPAGDPEIRMLPTFKNCTTVLALPLRAGDEVYGVYLIGSNEPNPFEDIHLEMMLAVTNQAVAAIRAARLYEDLLLQRDRLVNLEKATRAQLAADLHDGPTQGVSAIAMRLNYIRKLLEKKPEAAMNELYQIEDMARRTAREIRTFLFELRPKSLDDGLEAGLRQLALQMKETYDQNVEISAADRLDEALDDQTKQTLFSITVEALNNARKHAGADLIRVHLNTRDKTLVYTVSDNGAGFDVDKALAEARRREGHLGLLNLYERAAIIEGTLHIDSEPGKGTTITVLVPMDFILHRRQEERRRERAEQGLIP
jgi:signal transduction histidine kinase